MSGAPDIESRSKRRDKRHQDIVETAAKLFAEAGYADCDMERVASALGIAKGTLYLYFAGKQELFFACVDWGMKQLQHVVRAGAESTDEPFEKIHHAIRAYLVFFEDHPQYVELLLQERAIFRDRVSSSYFDHRKTTRDYFRQLYTTLIADGRLRDDVPVERILDTIGALVYGTMFTNHFVGRSLTPDVQYETLMEAVFRGWLSDSERAKWRLCQTQCESNPTAG